MFLKNPGLYKSVSAFAPICNPTDARGVTKPLQVIWVIKTRTPGR